MKKIFACIFALVLGGAVTVATFAQPTYAVDCNPTLPLGFRPWYHGMAKEVDVNGSSSCVIETPDSATTDDDTTATFVWRIILNITIDLTLAVSYGALIFIIYGGFRYILSTGEPAKVNQAKTTIFNALIGFVIALLATVIVNTIITIIGGSTS